ncbi:MAG: phosphatidate cytidylyltransferase [Clostridia bacterium]|nr:phosphatidate cytidylyltransferase [Clostridia bacterium]
MKTRIITGLVLALLLVLVLLSNVYVITGAVAVIAIMGLYEFYKATGIKDHIGLCTLGYVAGLFVVLRQYTPSDKYMLAIYAFMLCLFVIMLKDHKKISVTEAGLVIFSIIYIPLFLSTLTGIYNLQNGIYFLWLVFIGAFMTDTCAYFSGCFFGKHKLCPDISPKKTIEGSIGGSLGCVAIVLLYGLLLEKQFGLNVNYIKLGILGLLIAIISQIGDLTASIIKRKYGVKDYGTLFPGHGGILDRLDSIIATAPLVYIYLTTIGA